MHRKVNTKIEQFFNPGLLLNRPIKNQGLPSSCIYPATGNLSNNPAQSDDNKKFMSLLGLFLEVSNCRSSEIRKESMVELYIAVCYSMATH